MLLAFDKYGKLIRQLTHGAPARQGSEDTFTVRCYFKDINVNRYDIALISLQRPDGTYIEVTEALDFERNYTFYRQPEDDINTAPFVEGTNYPVFSYTVTDPAIFNQYGTYRATILLYHDEVAEETLLMSGVFQIPVQKTTYSGDSNITIDQFNNLIKLLAGKLDIHEGIRVVNELPEDNIFDSELYKPNEIIFCVYDHGFYKLNSQLKANKIGITLRDLTIPSENDIILLNGEELATKTYVAEHGGAVQSVNGKTGHVTLNAHDVGATTQEYVDNRINGVDFVIGIS